MIDGQIKNNTIITLCQNAKYFSLKYDSKKNLYILSINDNAYIFNIRDIYKECKNKNIELFTKDKDDEIIINKPMKVEWNNKRKNVKIDFQRCKFKEKVYFTNCEFNGNVFFNHTTFCKYADFHESIFNGIVSFYNVTFKSAPNFSTCVFGNLQATNFINVKIDSLDFDSVEDFVKEYKNDKSYDKKLGKDNEFKIRYASNARDSFRTIKNVLIENNNLIDASKWHKLELYAKEREIDLKKPKKFSKEWFDWLQLLFYRKTSAHHTDLLKILSWFVILVGAFATALFFEKNFFNKKILWSILLGSLSIVLCLSIIFDKIKFFVFLAISSYIPCIWLLTWNPKYIFGIANLFGHDKCQNDWFLNLLMSVYGILFILVIFSLQKTARKNSIIPS